MQTADGRPMQCSYSSDGTPIATRLRRHLGSADNPQSQKVVGFQTHEYLVQSCFVRYNDGAGSPHTTVVLGEPVALVHGKSALAMFPCGR